MKRRRIAMMTALIVMTVLLALVIRQRAGLSSAYDRHAVRLGSGETLEGILVQLKESTYLLQTDELCLMLTAGEIDAVDGEVIPGTGLPALDEAMPIHETYEEVLESGDVELHSKIRRVNEGTKIISRVNWGLARHEVDRLRDYTIYDEFGNEVPFQVEDDPRIDGKRIWVDLPRPVLPGEETELTVVILERDRIGREGGTLVYRMRGDYPEDRLVTRSVRLPLGAEVLSVTPEPLHRIEAGGRQLVIWRRYFRKGEVIPWEIRYRI